MPRQTSIGPEARIIRDFDLLSPEGQRIVRDIINAKQPAPKTQEARAPRASKKGLPPAAPNANGQAAATPAASKPAKAKKCDVCYEDKDYPAHDKSMGYADYHEFDPGKSGKKSKRKESLPLTGGGAQSENTSALAVGVD